MAYDICLLLMCKSYSLYTTIDNTLLVCAITKVMSINITDTLFILKIIIDKSDKSLEAFSLFTMSNVALINMKNKT